MHTIVPSPPVSHVGQVDLNFVEAFSLSELLPLLRAGARAVQCCDAELPPRAAAEALRGSQVEALVLSSNELGPEGVDLLAPALASCPHLRRGFERRACSGHGNWSLAIREDWIGMRSLLI